MFVWRFFFSFADSLSGSLNVYEPICVINLSDLQEACAIINHIINL